MSTRIRGRNAFLLVTLVLTSLNRPFGPGDTLVAQPSSPATVMRLLREHDEKTAATAAAG
jgi:hypothetical protein